MDIVGDCNFGKKGIFPARVIFTRQEVIRTECSCEECRRSHYYWDSKKKCVYIAGIKWFNSKNYVVEEPYRGIYYIHKDGFFVTQIVVIKELSKENHLFLTSITKEMSREDAESLAKAVAGLTDKEDKDNADAVLQVAMKVNEQLFQMLKEDDVMCDALREFFKDELQESNERGIASGIKIGTANGTAIGKAEAIIEFLEEKGEVPEELAKVITSQKDLVVLKQWIKFAARADSIEEFENLTGLVK